MSKNKYLFPFILITLLFFLWAFLHNLNPILIPHLKKACQLTDTQSSLIDFPVYLAYAVIAIPAGLFVHKYGYKKSILLGLALFAAGTLLFIPAASARSYIFFLGALFVSASGATFLETVANPYASLLGDPSKSEQRLNFAQSFNGVGAFLAPIIGGMFILSGIEYSPEQIQSMSPTALDSYLQSEANGVKLPYLIISLGVFFVFLLFLFTKLPEVKEPGSEVHGTEFSLSVFKYSHVKWAVISEFCYVGAQVGVGSFFIRLTKSLVGMPEKHAAQFWWGSIAMVGFMVGRFTGTFFMKYIKPAKLLSIYAIINISLLAIAIMVKGYTAVYAVCATMFFMSIMFPTIFALGIKDLGEETKFASSFLVMAIIGGAFCPFLMGLISDASGSMLLAYIVPLISFIPILYFGLKGHKVVQPTVVQTVKA